MIIKSEYSFDEVPSLKALPSLIFESMQLHADRTFLIDAVTGEEYSYQLCYDYCCKIAHALHNDFSIRKGDVILMLSNNCAEHIWFKYGAAAIGAVLPLTSPLQTVDELRYYLNDSKPVMIFTTQGYASKVKKAARFRPEMRNIIVLGEAKGCVSFSKLLENNSKSIPKVEFDPKNDTIMMPYSSGTTGKPKGVMLTHWNLVLSTKHATSRGFEILNPATREVILLYTPFHNSFSIYYELLAVLGGHTAVIVPRFELHKFINVVKTYKVTLLSIVPPTVVQLTKNPMVRAADFDSVHTFIYGSAPVGGNLEREFSRKFPKQELRQVYGLTEITTFALCVPRGSRLRPGTAGKLVPGVEMRFIDTETGKDVGQYTNGEILLRGGQLMKGYFGNPKKTKETIDSDGFLHTGDVGYYDRDGFVYIVDRIKDLIKYKATQVSPADIEGLILSHPAVADTAVVGVPDEEAGQLPRAYVVLKHGHQATENDIIEFVKERVSSHKRLRGGVKFIGKIPKSPNGKILRRVLMEDIKKEFSPKAKI